MLCVRPHLRQSDLSRIMPEWLQALQQLYGGNSGNGSNSMPSILITVTEAQGSTPRAAGARMVVTQAGRQYDTIGGGHLELRAIELAQAILHDANADAIAQPSTPQLHRFPLGPALGQCCGGTVQLLFEKIDPGAQANAMVAALVQAWEQERDNHPQVLLFGAGHVGRALAALLGSLPCRLLWIDERDDLFPAVLPANATIEISDDPESAVRNAAAGSYFIVMTHSHAIDLQLSERILRRGDAAWFGLIGSDTKRRLFRKRLAQRGLSEQQLAGMTCPIGIGGIDNKEPASIAVAVAAQLLQLWAKNKAKQGGNTLII
jgi:xanthine dehydrogenase accessory factor